MEQKSWTAEELQAFLRAASGHRLFPALWVSAFTGMRRNELLGLRWDARRADVTVIRLHDVRHTHGTLLIAAGVPVKVASERLGHATPVFTIDTNQHVCPACRRKQRSSSSSSSSHRLYRRTRKASGNDEGPGR